MIWQLLEKLPAANRLVFTESTAGFAWRVAETAAKNTLKGSQQLFAK